MSTIQARFRFVPIAVLATILGLAGSAAAQTEADFQNVWVHYDYMVFPKGWTSLGGVTYPDGLSMAPSQEAIDKVVEAFRAQGLTLHIDPEHNAIPGHQVVYPDFDSWWSNPSAACVGPDAVSFMALKNQYFQPHDNHPWHYAIFGFNVALPDTSPDGSACPVEPLGQGHPDPTATGISQLPGFNFILGFGTFIELTGLPWPPPVNSVGAAFMHELGHNFGLEHGGVLPGVDAFLTNKPNYISVMNYSYYYNGIPIAAQPGSATPAHCNADSDCPGGCHCTSGFLGGNVCYRLDYSNQTLLTLNEASLDETLGVGGPPGDTDIVIYYAYGAGVLYGPSSGPIDWNNDGKIESSAQGDIDNDNNLTNHILHGFDDWSYVKQQLQVPPEAIESGPKRIQYEEGSRGGPFRPR
jgi:hypothetical protein